MNRIGFGLHLFLILLLCSMLHSCKEDSVAFPQIATIQSDNSMLGVYEVAINRKVPWEICWGPDGKIWMTEQEGEVSRLDPSSGEIKSALKVPDVWFKRTAGLLGMDLYKESDGTIYAFLNYTHQKDTLVTSKLVRYRLERDSLVEPFLVLQIPGNHSHNGSRLKISNDGIIYWATGDAHRYGNAQDSTSLNGKILRINRDGSIPDDNPIPGSPVWAWGFRNMQGLTEATSGKWYASEHGEATDDEINLLQSLGNYGWPQIEGYADSANETRPAFANRINPIKAWTPTIAPAGLAYYNTDRIPEWKNSLLLVSLKAQSLRVLKLDKPGEKITDEIVLLEGVYGRIRSITVSPDGDVYMATSNRDWNPGPGFPKATDDRIVKISPAKESKGELLKPKRAALVQVKDGAGLYNQYCASCHKPNGSGVNGSFPSMVGNAVVINNADSLVQRVLQGKNQMPSFSFMKDEELAMVLSYIRTAWSNEAGEITPAAIQKNRTNN